VCPESEDVARAQGLAAHIRRLEAGDSGLSWCPHEPHPKQRAFLSCEAFEAFYGGAAGGGKSDALLMAALQFAHVPGYAALILRRTFPDLNKPGAIMDRAKEWLIAQGVEWNAVERRFRFPSGATISFGYLDTDKDKYQYQGAELQFVGFDEVTQIPEPWYLYLLSRIRRRVGVEVPLRARTAGNPGGIGHAWVKRRFVDSVDDSRAFIPAKLEDNPSLDHDEYARTLSLLDPITRRQLLEGVWVQDGSGLVYRQYREDRNTVDVAPADLRWRVMGIDYGLVDSCAWTIWGWRPHDQTLYGLLSEKQDDLTAVDAAEHTQRLLATMPCARIVGDVGGLGKGYAEEARRRYRIPVEPADKVNKRGYIDLLNGDLARGKVKLVRGACEPLEKEWRELPWDEARLHESAGADNHCADSALYGWREATAYSAKEARLAPPVITSGAAFQQREEALLRAGGTNPKPFWMR
jgi:hypothetical protein